MEFSLNLYIMPIWLKSHYSEFHGACCWLCYSGICHRAINCISSLQNRDETADPPFLCRTGKGMGRVRYSESPACCAQAFWYSTWNIGFGCFVCFLLNDSATGRRRGSWGREKWKDNYYLGLERFQTHFFKILAKQHPLLLFVAWKDASSGAVFTCEKLCEQGPGNETRKNRTQFLGWSIWCWQFVVNRIVKVSFFVFVFNCIAF